MTRQVRHVIWVVRRRGRSRSEFIEAAGSTLNPTSKSYREGPWLEYFRFTCEERQLDQDLSGTTDTYISGIYRRVMVPDKNPFESPRPYSDKLVRGDLISLTQAF
jgi:hypothetical protein